MQKELATDAFADGLARLINHHSQENASDTPDFILTQYVLGCLAAWNNAVLMREKWYGREADALEAVSASRPPQEPAPATDLTTILAKIDGLVETYRDREAFWPDTGLLPLSKLTPLFKQLKALASVSPPAPETWRDIATAPKDGTLIIGALIRDGIWRVHEMRHNGLAFYTIAGGSLPQMTHWLPIPAPPSETP